MDHADAIGRLEAAVAGPGHLAAIEADRSPQGVALREHLASCPACSGELRAWSIIEVGLAVATPDSVIAPPAARDRILASVLANGVVRGAVSSAAAAPHGAPAPPSSMGQAAASSEPQPFATPRPPGSADVRPAAAAAPATAAVGLAVMTGGRQGRSAAPARNTAGGRSAGGLRFRWLALGAAAALLLFVAGALLGGPLGLTQPSETTSTNLAGAIAMTADILASPTHAAASLTTAQGTEGGAVLVSPESGDMVVISRALAPLPEGKRYACFIVRDGVRTKVGYMRFAGDLAYWAGPATAVATPGIPGDEFIVVPEDQVTQPPTLSGTF